MPIVDGVRTISRIYPISRKRQDEIAEKRRKVEQFRARKRLEKALRPARRPEARAKVDSKAERQEFLELRLVLYQIGLMQGLQEEEELAVEAKLWAWLRSPRKLTWGQFTRALRLERFGPEPSPEPVGRRPWVNYGDWRRSDGW